VLNAIVNQCCDFFEGERYVLPADKHRLLRVIPYTLLLMDGDNNSPHNVFKNKKVLPNLKRIATIFKVKIFLLLHPKKIDPKKKNNKF
jgi:hypothetical protein